MGLGFASLGIGVFISMRIFNIPDITTDGSYALGAVITGIMLSHNVPILIVLFSAFIAGTLSGFSTALLSTKLKVNTLLSGILITSALYSINLVLMGRSNLPLLNFDLILDLFSFIENKILRELIILFLFAATVWFIISWLLKTDFGLSMRATGNNENMIKAFGVDADKMKILGLGISNGLVALSGFMISQYQGFVDINMGVGIVILGLGSVMIGETIANWLRITSIELKLVSVIIGCILFRLILALTLSLGVDPILLKLITAIIVLVFVSLPNLRRITTLTVR